LPYSLLLQHIAAFTLGLSVTWLLIPVIIHQAHERGMLDEPDGERRLHRTAVPRLGGVGIFIGTAVTSLIVLAIGFGTGQANLPYPTLLPGVALGAALIFATGLVDDLRGLGPRGKLVLQTLAAIAVVGFGFRIDNLILTATGGSLSLGYLSIPLTIFWIVGMTNAFNLIDGVDGLAGSVALIALATSIGVDIYLHDPRSLVISLAMLGAVFGFLRYNNNPARIFLGDSGSMTLGFFLAIRLVISSTTTDGRTYALVPLFALAFPLLDTFIAIARRWLRGHPFSRADGRHIHHQLLALGLAPRLAVDLLGIVFAGVAALGISITFAPPQFTLAFFFATILLAIATFVYGARWLRYGEFAELALSVASVIRNARLVVREKIVANEVAEQIRRAQTLEEVRELLGGLVDDLRVLDIELVAGNVHHHGPERQQISPPDQLPIRLDYPFAWHTDGGTREIILRLWSTRPESGEHPATERVATRIGPALEEWFQRHPAEGVPGLAPESVPQPRLTPTAFRRFEL
jgi:UDP-GlcNAc:undecaprenyl-phosphate GlcNAc-1-phosphate transferase